MLTTIRKATVNDKTRIMEIYAYARQFMAEHGNPNQWKNNNPSEETRIRLQTFFLSIRGRITILLRKQSTTILPTGKCM